ncbi:MAG: lysophospholipid acyltransferase family protein [Spirochaetes bacterium]|nr:lysophospholipid acyltransferase family protein [Spirochaetota bacterium]
MARNGKSIFIALLEFIPALVILGILWLFPYRWGVQFGKVLGRIGFKYAASARNDAIAGLTASFPDWSPERVRETALRSFEHMGMYFLEVVLFPKLSNRYILKRLIRPVNHEIVEKLLAEGKGIVALSIHMGNPEFPGAYIGISGNPVHAVSRRMDNPFFQTVTASARAKKGINVIPRDNALRKIFEALKENHPVAFLVDQNWAAGGVFVPFFGRLAATAKGPIQFAMKTGAKVLITYDVRNSDDVTHTAYFVREMVLEHKENDEETIRYNTAKYTKMYEDIIRQHPEQWLWAHGRWSTRPREEECRS